jgi:hypothetical protein
MISICIRWIYVEKKLRIVEVQARPSTEAKHGHDPISTVLISDEEGSRYGLLGV